MVSIRLKSVFPQLIEREKYNFFNINKSVKIKIFDNRFYNKKLDLNIT